MADETVDVDEWELERPESASFEWDPTVDDDEDSEDEEPPAAEPPAAEPPAAEPSAAVEPEDSEPAAQTGEPESDAAPSVAETHEEDAFQNADVPEEEVRDDETVRSWLLGEVLDEPPAAADEASGAFDSASEASFASFAQVVDEPHAAVDEPPLAAEPPAAAPAADEPQVDEPPLEPDPAPGLQAVFEEEDDAMSEASFYAVAGEGDRFAIEPTQPAIRVDEPPNRVRRVELPPRLDATAGGGGGGFASERAHAHLNDLPSLRAQLRSLGPLGEQLYALAAQQAAASRRTLKHTPQAERNAVGENEWWRCLLESLGVQAAGQLQ